MIYRKNSAVYFNKTNNKEVQDVPLTAPTPVTDAPMTEQEIADNAYLRRLADMTTEELDFVRQHHS